MHDDFSTVADMAAGYIPIGRLMQLTLPVPPSVNVYWRKWRNRMVLSEKGRSYRAQVLAARLRRATTVLAETDEVLPNGIRFDFKATAIPRAAFLPMFPTGDVQVAVVWYRAARRGDVDNIAKGLLDGLRRVAYADDRQVAKLTIERVDRPYRGEPRVEVRIATCGMGGA